MNLQSASFICLWHSRIAFRFLNPGKRKTEMWQRHCVEMEGTRGSSLLKRQTYVVLQLTASYNHCSGKSIFEKEAWTILPKTSQRSFPSFQNMTENILRGQQLELQALPRAVTRNTERWIHSKRGCWDPEQHGKTPQANSCGVERGIVGIIAERVVLPWPRHSSAPGCSCVCLLHPRGWQVGSTSVSDMAPWLGKPLCNAICVMLCCSSKCCSSKCLARGLRQLHWHGIELESSWGILH